MRNTYKIFVGKPEETTWLDLGVDGWIIIEWILGKWNGKVWTGFIWLMIRIGGGSCEHGNKLSGPVKG
jgi:hypothetical protein